MAPTKILNPATGRMVLASGKIGQAILVGKKSSKRSSKRSSKKSSNRSSKKSVKRSSAKRASPKKAASKKPSIRKAPAESATLYPPGTMKVGANGEDMFVVRATAAGIQRWFKMK